MPNRRPYRVGMARPTQRYIEPDAIYEDLSRGRATRIPERFPFSWNPVNGLGAATVATTSSISDVFSSIINSGTSAAGDEAGNQVEDFLDNNPAGKILLDKVQAKAAAGVTAVVKKNAPNLIVLALAGGAVGGAIAAKLGKAGIAVALGVGLVAALNLLNPDATTPPK